jgi:hypothetical protein
MEFPFGPSSFPTKLNWNSKRIKIIWNDVNTILEGKATCRQHRRTPVICNNCNYFFTSCEDDTLASLFWIFFEYSSVADIAHLTRWVQVHTSSNIQKYSPKLLRDPRRKRRNVVWKGSHQRSVR